MKSSSLSIWKFVVGAVVVVVALLGLGACVNSGEANDPGRKFATGLVESAEDGLILLGGGDFTACNGLSKKVIKRIDSQTRPQYEFIYDKKCIMSDGKSYIMVNVNVSNLEGSWDLRSAILGS